MPLGHEQGAATKNNGQCQTGTQLSYAHESPRHSLHNLSPSPVGTAARTSRRSHKRPRAMAGCAVWVLCLWQCGHDTHAKRAPDDVTCGEEQGHRGGRKGQEDGDQSTKKKRKKTTDKLQRCETLVGMHTRQSATYNRTALAHPRRQPTPFRRTGSTAQR